MIQRKQTLYLLSILIISTILLVVPSASVDFNNQLVKVYLLPFDFEGISASAAQMAAMLINFISLILAFTCIFLYKKRNLQLTMSYSLMIIWLLLTLIMSFMPLVNEADGVVIQNTNYGTLLGIFGMLGSYMAARLIKRDIELLKSADRIR